MKHIILIILMLGCTYLRAQNPDNTLNAFKQKKVATVVSCSSYPFIIEVGGNDDTQIIKDPNHLKARLSQLFSSESFGNISDGKIIRLSKTQFSITVRSFNNKGQLESESSIVFDFIQKGQSYKLCKIYILRANKSFRRFMVLRRR